MLSSKTMELGLYATDELYISSKWPFWPASITIHSILVYRDARNSSFYNIVIPFKDGVTFVVTTATQSLQCCYLEFVADMTYVAVINVIFEANFCNFDRKRIQQWSRGYRGTQRVPKKFQNAVLRHPKTTKNHGSKQNLRSDLLHRLSSDFVFQPFDD